MKKSKLAKVLTVSLAALMVFGLASCGGGSGKVSDKDITVISREEGSYLMVFCNNVSPAFFVNYICIAKLGFTKVPPILFCVFYGVPLLYGYIYGRFFYKAPVSSHNISGAVRSVHTGASLVIQKQVSIHRIDFPMLDVSWIALQRSPAWVDTSFCSQLLLRC